MYKQFYNLEEYPFNITADPDYLFLSHHHSEALAHLVYGIQQRKGIMTITGEIGTGKTTICGALLNRLPNYVRSSLLLNPSFSGLQLLQAILQDFGFSHVPATKNDCIAALNRFLIHETSLGHNVVLIIDEAQNLNPPELEEIRLLSNLETQKEKLLQIVLFGQPELEEKLRLPVLRQLNQRISVRYHIPNLSQEDCRSYIVHRLARASESREPATQLKFTSQAVNHIFEKTQGSPRLINILCDRALLAGFASGDTIINAEMVDICAKEIFKYEHHS